jgi:hypothetical protein
MLGFGGQDMSTTSYGAIRRRARVSLYAAQSRHAAYLRVEPIRDRGNTGRAIGQIREDFITALSH